MKSSHRILRSSIALTAVTAAGTAQAEVQWSGPLDLITTNSDPIYFDLNGDSVDDYRVLMANSQATKPSLSSAVEHDPSKLVLLDPNGVTDEGANGFPVTPEGTTIDGSYLDGGADWEGWFYMNWDNQLSGGFYNNGEGAEGYVGLAIPGENGINYGWAHLTFVPNPGALILHDFAYETEAGTGIVTGTIPEPSSIALLAAGFGGLALLRARRKQA